MSPRWIINFPTKAHWKSFLPGASAEANDVVAGQPELQERIDRVLALADGFESAYGMELLATVHWAATEEGCADRLCVVETVHGWNDRKERLFTTVHISTALNHLVEHGWQPAHPLRPESGVSKS